MYSIFIMEENEAQPSEKPTQNCDPRKVAMPDLGHAHLDRQHEAVHQDEEAQGRELGAEREVRLVIVSQIT